MQSASGSAIEPSYSTTSTCIVRPPPWVYEEIEEAIRHAIAGDHTAEIESRDGHRYVVAGLVERWELEDMLEVYRRAPDDPSYPS